MLYWLPLNTCYKLVMCHWLRHRNVITVRWMLLCFGGDLLCVLGTTNENWKNKPTTCMHSVPTAISVIFLPTKSKIQSTTTAFLYFLNFFCETGNWKKVHSKPHVNFCQNKNVTIGNVPGNCLWRRLQRQDKLALHYRPIRTIFKTSN